MVIDLETVDNDAAMLLKATDELVAPWPVLCELAGMRTAILAEEAVFRQVAGLGPAVSPARLVDTWRSRPPE